MGALLQFLKNCSHLDEIGARPYNARDVYHCAFKVRTFAKGTAFEFPCPAQRWRNLRSFRRSRCCFLCQTAWDDRYRKELCGPSSKCNLIAKRRSSFAHPLGCAPSSRWDLQSRIYRERIGRSLLTSDYKRANEIHSHCLSASTSNVFG